MFLLIFACMCLFADTLLDNGTSRQNCTLLCNSDMEKSDPIVVVNDRVNITVYPNAEKPNERCIVTAKHDHKEDNMRANTSGNFYCKPVAYLMNNTAS